jgi:hypothetical protein
MDVTNGDYYRRKEDGAVVKVLYYEVYPYECSCGIGTRWCAPPGVLYRLNDDPYPHRREFISMEAFLNDFEGGLVWDPEAGKFK